jgi:hypothetical protein
MSVVTPKSRPISRLSLSVMSFFALLGAPVPEGPYVADARTDSGRGARFPLFADEQGGFPGEAEVVGVEGEQREQPDSLCLASSFIEYPTDLLTPVSRSFP